MLQCALTGKAQEAYSFMKAKDSFSYSKIKSAVLKAYGLVPEAYQQCFRLWKRKNGQTYVEDASDLNTHLKRWLTVLNIASYKLYYKQEKHHHCFYCCCVSSRLICHAY